MAMRILDLPRRVSRLARFLFCLRGRKSVVSLFSLVCPLSSKVRGWPLVLINTIRTMHAISNE